MQPHKLDFVSLVSGLIFVAIGVGHLLGVNLWGLWQDLDALLPILVIIAGAALLLRVLRRTRED
jgi:hypothetical protein